MTANLIGVKHRQFRQHHLLENNLISPVHLGTVIRRAIGHKKKFGSAFGKRFRHAEIAPDILADRNADAHAPKIDRSRQRPGLEHALFIELAIIGKIDLEPLGKHLAAIQHHDRIMQTAFPPQRRSNDDTRPAIRRIGGQFAHGFFTGFNEGRLQHQILRRITGNEQLCEQDEIGLHLGGLRASRASLSQISGDIAHDGIELRDCNTKHNEILTNTISARDLAWE